MILPNGSNWIQFQEVKNLLKLRRAECIHADHLRTKLEIFISKVDYTFKICLPNEVLQRVRCWAEEPRKLLMNSSHRLKMFFVRYCSSYTAKLHMSYVQLEESNVHVHCPLGGYAPESKYCHHYWIVKFDHHYLIVFRPTSKKKQHIWNKGLISLIRLICRTGSLVFRPSSKQPHLKSPTRHS